MSSHPPLWTLTATELGTLLRRREIGALDVLNSVVSRLDEVNGLINAVVTRNPFAEQEAIESQRRLDANAARSVLEGVPVTIKDNLLARGMCATWGSRAYAEFEPEHNELPIARLRAAGAVVIGKTNVPEFTVEGYTTNPLFGTTRNPWNVQLTPGGSSGGAVAALAAGVGPIAIGTDGGGSIRRPAGFAGVIGVKPSIGRVPRHGGFPRILLDMEVVGPMARSVSDARAVLDVLGGPDPRDPTSLQAASTGSARTSLRVCVVPRIGDAPVDPGILHSFSAAAEALAEMGHQVSTSALPFDIGGLVEAWPTIGAVGVRRLLTERRIDLAQVGAAARTMAAAADEVSAHEFAATVELIHAFRGEANAAFDAFDVLLTPASAAMPWPADEPFPPTIAGQSVGPRGHAVYSGWVNAAGLPAVSVPCPRMHAGLPVGAQLVGAMGSDAMLLDLAESLEAAHPWRDRWPALATALRSS